MCQIFALMRRRVEYRCRGRQEGTMAENGGRGKGREREIVCGNVAVVVTEREKEREREKRRRKLNMWGDRRGRGEESDKGEGLDERG